MGKIEIHGVVASPPVRAVMMVCELQQIPYELKKLVPLEKTPEFKKLNPQQQIPVLVDGDFILPESRAIITYLMDKYAKDDSLYPKDLQKRATINARLDFDCGTLWPRNVALYRPYFFGGEVKEEAIQSLKDVLSTVEEFLTREKWIAGSKMSVADISLYSVIAVQPKFELIDLKPYTKISSWLEECDKVPIMKKLVEEGVTELKQIIAQIKNKA